MSLDPRNYSPDTVALNRELFGLPSVERVQPKRRKQPKRSKLEIDMQDVIDTALSQFPHLKQPETEYRFAAIATGGTGKGVRARLRTAGLKDWRFDFAWPDYVLAIEVEGGTHTQGRHVRGKGFEDDCDKYNYAALNGWMLLRFTGAMIKDGRALDAVLAALEVAEAFL